MGIEVHGDEAKVEGVWLAEVSLSRSTGRPGEGREVSVLSGGARLGQTHSLTSNSAIDILAGGVEAGRGRAQTLLLRAALHHEGEGGDLGVDAAVERGVGGAQVLARGEGGPGVAIGVFISLIVVLS